MTLTLETGSQPASVSASQISTAEECLARWYHEQQGYTAGLLDTDRIAADVSRAAHDALMNFHRQMEQADRYGRLAAPNLVPQQVKQFLDYQLRRKRLDRSSPVVADRLDRALPGFHAAAAQIVADMPSWAVDPVYEDKLVWAEGPLDHGPATAAVELAPDVLVRTRPDVIGLRRDPSGVYRVLVRDFKAKGEPVDPAYDTGILVRAIWALLEIQNPRCRWFLSGRTIAVDPDVVDLETVNLLHFGTSDFSLTTHLSATYLLAERDRIVAKVREMTEALEHDDASAVPATPNGLCFAYCPFLAYCQPGQAHVRKYRGEDALTERLRN